MSDQIILLENITSSFKKDLVYGLKGEKVKLISIHGDVLLVSDRKGNGFSVRMEKTDYGLV